MKNLNRRRNPAPALHRWRDLAHHFLGTSLSRVLLLLVAGFLSTATVTAQNGNVAYSENSIDSRMRTSMHVDPISGALQFQIALGNYPGRAGAGLPIVLNYSSKLWRLDHVSTTGGCNQFGYCFNQVSDYVARFAESSAAGWTSNLDWFIWPSGESPIHSYDSQGRPAENMGEWYAARMFVRLPDGSKHELRRDDTVWSGNPGGGVFYAVDGSRLRYHTDTGTLWLPDGSRYVGNAGNKQYIDRNGNTLTYNGTSWTDTLGRTIGLPLPAFSTTGEQSQASARDEYYSIPGVAGTSLTYTFKWRRLVDVRTDSGQALRPKGDRVVNSCVLVSSLFTSPGYCGTDEDHRITSSADFNPVVLHQIVLPNGSAYTFTYNIYGEIDKVVYPTGAYEKFTHGQAPELSANFNSDQIGNFYAQANRGVNEQRISADGTEGSEVLWQYSSLGPVTWTTAPDGTRTERSVHQSQGQLIAYGFDDPRAGLIYDERVSAPNNGPMLRRKLTEWVVDGSVQYDGPRPMYKTRNPRPAREVEIILDTGGNALAATTTYQYDADLNVIATNRYAFVEVDQTTAQNGAIGAIPSGSLVRIEDTDYLTNNQAYRDRNLLSLPTAARIKDAAGTIIAQSQMLYDEAAYPLLPCGAASGWSDPGASARGNVTTSKSWLNSMGGWIEAHAQFDQCGSGRKSWDGKGNLTEVQYSGSYQSAYPTTSISAVPDPTGQTGSSTSLTSSTSYDFYTGLVTSTTDQNNQTTTLEYATTDALGNANPLQRLTRATRPDGGWTAYGYSDQPGSLFVLARAALDSSRFIDSSKYFDGLGRPHRTYLNEGSGNYLVTDMQYDSLGRVWKVSNPYRTTTLNGAINPSGMWTTTSYDPLGRALTVTTPDSAVVSTSYSGNTVTVTDQAGKARKSVTDALGRLKEIYEDPSGLNYLTSYSYDTLDNLTTVSQGSQSRTFVYDSLKRLTSATNPESGTVSYQYDNNGNLTQKTDSRIPAVTTTYAYDALNRATTRNYSDGTPAVTYGYDAGGVANSKGRLTSVSSSVSTTNYTAYDALGRATGGAQTIGSQTYTMSYTFDNAGHVLTETYPSGRTVTNTYDDAGRTSSVIGNLGDGTNRTYSTGIVYSPFGGMTKEQFGTDTALYNKSRYNSRGQLSEILVSTSYTGPTDVTWNRGKLINWYSSQCGGAGCNNSDNNGNLMKQEVWIPANEQASSWTTWSQQYDYDNLNRLQRVKEYDSGATQLWQQEYVYDRWGNRTVHQTNTWGSIPKPNFGVDPANNNRLTVPAGYTMSYDGAGNVINDTYTGQGQRTYDAENRMKQAWANGQWQIYSYDGDGRRVKRNVNGVETWQVYGLGGELLAEYAANGSPSSPQKEYGYRNGQLLITAEAGAGSAGTAISFTDSPLVAGSTTIKGVHLTELRDGVNQARARAGLAAASWTDAQPVGALIKAVHLTELRSRLDEARTALNLSAASYTDPSLGGVTVKAVHVQELRTRTNEALTTVIGGGVDIRWLVADQLGTPRIIIDKTGALANVKRHDYLPFGEELFAGTGGRTTAQGYVGDSVRQKFTLKERDNETGLDYFEARYFASAQGRFTSVDPANYQAMLNPGEPQSWNAYSYVNNNPLIRTDPNGRGIGDFFKKLGNWLAWDVWGDSAAVKKEEERRRADLLRNADKEGGIIICSPVTGQYVRVFPNQMNRANVWLWSNAVYYWNEQGGGYHQLTPAQLAGVIDITAYRGGPNIEVRDIDVKIKDGMVQTTRGPSVNLDPTKVEKFGGAYRIESLPDELQLIQRGTNLSHYEIVPKNPMPLERFIELVKQVKLVPK